MPGHQKSKIPKKLYRNGMSIDTTAMLLNAIRVKAKILMSISAEI